MTAPATIPREKRVSPLYACDGVNRSFAVPFWFLDAADLVLDVTLPSGDRQTFAGGLGYSATGAGDPSGGAAILDVAPPDGAAVQIFGKRLASRLTSVFQGGQANGAALDAELSAVTVTQQELRRDVDTLAAAPAVLIKADAAGPLASRAAYDDRAPPFIFLQTDDAENRIVYYIKLSAAHADWSGPLIASFQPRPVVGPNVLTPEDYHASGSLQTTTASAVAANANVTLASAIDFAVGQGIRLNRCGATFALNLPTGLGVNVIGATGATTRKYAIRAIDDHGGLGPAVRASVANANATLSFANYCKLTWSAPAGTAPNGYAVYGRTNVADGSLTLIGVTSNLFFNDYGFNQAVDPDWAVADDAGGPFNGFHVATITALNGLVATVNPAPLQSAAGVVAAHDDTAAIQTMLAAGAVPQSYYFAKLYPVSTTIFFSKLGGYAGAAHADQNLGNVMSGLIWRGAPVATAAQFGDTSGAAVSNGGALRDMMFDAGGVCDTAFLVKDARYPKLYNLGARKATRRQLHITGTGPAETGVLAPKFYDAFIDSSIGFMCDAHLVEIDGVNNCVTMCHFYGLRGAHMAGHGFYWPPGVGKGSGDGLLLVAPFIWRDPSWTGHAIHCATDDPAMTTGAACIQGPGILVGGMYFAQPDQLEYWAVNDFDDVNVGATAISAVPLSGNGVGAVGVSTLQGAYHGWKQHPGGYTGAFNNDRFGFVSIGAQGLITEDGAWLYQLNAGTAVDSTSGVPGIDLVTAATLNDRVSIFRPPGNSKARHPKSIWSVYSSEVANFRWRVGYLSDVNATPASGVFWLNEAGVLKCVCRDAGVETVVTPEIPALSLYRLRVEFGPYGALFYWSPGGAGESGLAGNGRWAFAAHITTNVPASYLSLAAQITALAAAAKRLTLLHCSSAKYLTGW